MDFWEKIDNYFFIYDHINAQMLIQLFVTSKKYSLIND